MENRLFGSIVETTVEVFFKLSYHVLMDLEEFLIEKNVIGSHAQSGICDDFEF
jgi:hypothetical protein